MAFLIDKPILGFDIINGARPMERVIQEKIKIPLAEIILKTKIESGSIKIDYCLMHRGHKIKSDKYILGLFDYV